MCSGTVEPGRISVRDSWRAQRRDSPPPGHLSVAPVGYININIHPDNVFIIGAVLGDSGMKSE